jgi:phage tail sheath protein FI
VAERALAGITIAEQNGPENAIARVSLAATAFIGRALKGPVNTPVSIASFAEYQRVFGGLWQPSTLSYALEQYFDNGGRQAIVVRIANGGRPPTLQLPAAGGKLTLIGQSPGTREFLRASVDYDGLTANEPDRFNLVLQRTRAAVSERVEDQEIFRRLSIRPDAARNVVDALTESRLARVLGDLPSHRPERTPAAASGAVVGYVGANTDGDDGLPLTDYDLIGSAAAQSGLFALAGAPFFGMLCIPPLTREQDVGLSTWLVASRICRQRHALLLIDPPMAWETPAQAILGARQWPLRADNAVMYFPRLLALDRLRGRFESFANCGAVAGMLARSDEQQPVWAAERSDQLVLRPNMRPACVFGETDQQRLAQVSVNSFQAVRLAADNEAAGGPRTLADGNSGSSDWRYLRARRVALFVTASIEQGTRWTIFEANNADTWARVRAQTSAFLESLAQEGAFGQTEGGDAHFVICDGRLNNAEARAAGKLHILFGIAASRPGEYHGWLLTHQSGSSRVRQVSVNRLATAGARVGSEIESSLLRSIAANY